MLPSRRAVVLSGKNLACRRSQIQPLPPLQLRYLGQQELIEGRGCGSVVEHVLGMQKVPGSIRGISRKLLMSKT